jgi:hypothetical protein
VVHDPKSNGFETAVHRHELYLRGDGQLASQFVYLVGSNAIEGRMEHGSFFEVSYADAVGFLADEKLIGFREGVIDTQARIVKDDLIDDGFITQFIPVQIGDAALLAGRQGSPVDLATFPALHPQHLALFERIVIRLQNWP